VNGHPIGGELGERPGAFIDAVKESSTWQTSSGASMYCSYFTEIIIT
jgi:hypothetical protein